ncbi:MAG: hypothetical protein WAL95_04920 [Candidatus Acidiferrales bacterium]
MGWFKKPPAPVEPQCTTDEDRLAEARRIYHEAEAEFKAACQSLGPLAQSRTNGLKPFGDQILLQVDTNQERLRLSRECEHARQRWTIAMQTLNRTERELGVKHEEVHVAGALVSP